MYAKVRTLYNQVPILSLSKIADEVQATKEDLQEYCMNTGIASSLDEYRYRGKFISYCLESEHELKCKYCGIRLNSELDEYFHRNNGGFCNECLERFECIIYDESISWYRNMMDEDWLPTNTGWINSETGRYLPKKYQNFFKKNKVTP